MIQLVPATARRFGLSDPFDAARSIEAAARYLRALHEAERSGEVVDANKFYETAELEIAAVDQSLSGRIQAAVDDRENHLQKLQTSVVGIDQVRSSSPFDRPKISERSAMPLCFASTHEQRNVFVRGWRAFVAAFRKASKDFRDGVLGVIFPPFSFRPSTPTSS